MNKDEYLSIILERLPYTIDECKCKKCGHFGFNTCQNDVYCNCKERVNTTKEQLLRVYLDIFALMNFDILEYMYSEGTLEDIEHFLVLSVILYMQKTMDLNFDMWKENLLKLRLKYPKLSAIKIKETYLLKLNSFMNNRIFGFDDFLEALETL